MTSRHRFTPTYLVAALATLGLAGCTLGGKDEPQPDLNEKPSYVGAIKAITYDGQSDDLLTAGLGKTGLASATAPSYADPLKPTAAELRRAAIYNNYRAIVDMTAEGGYGSLYGPNVDANGVVGSGEGKVAGTEYIAYSDDGSGNFNVTLMVQIPASFDPKNPCLITATSSGSRGVYGAISTGEWGLKKGCAVAYTDKGTGGAGHDLMADTVPLIDGTRVTSAAAGTGAAFRAPLTVGELSSFNATSPNRHAFKHAHSQKNPEKDWGKYTLQAVEFAYYLINEKYAEVDSASSKRLLKYRPGDVTVIASSISNGGGAAVAAAEQDSRGLISGLAVSEPAIEMPAAPGVQVLRGGKPIAVNSKTLVDFTTYANVYAPCAALALPTAPGAAYVVAGWAANRCSALQAKGLLPKATGSTTAELAAAALQQLRDYGWEGESDALHASSAAFEVPAAVAVTFANALARASVKDKLCGFSFAGATGAGAVSTVAPAAVAGMFATGNGVPPNSGVQLINDLSVGGPLRDLFSVSPSTGKQDFNIDGALCLRNLLTGTDATSLALQNGLNETRRNGNLKGKPAIIVHGRADALLPVNHTSRPYYALNKKVEGTASQLSYIEVTNAQHFDTFIGLPAVLPGYDTRYIPLHVYLFRALDAVYDKLKKNTALPPSQVVRTVPRGGTPGKAPVITAANVPAIAAAPVDANRIAFSGDAVNVPE